MRPGALTERYSVLAVEHGLRLHEILELSPRQQHDIYGRKEPQTAPAAFPTTPEQGVGRIHQLLGLIEAGVVKATPEQVAKLKGLADAGASGGNPGATAQ